MSKNSIPKIRFPEFKGKNTWKETKLSKVLFEHGNKSDGNEEVYSVSVHKGLINQIEHLGRSYSAKSTKHYKQVLPGDIIYTKSPTGNFPFGIIKQSLVDKKVIVSPLYGVFTPTTRALGYLLDVYFEQPLNTLNYLEPIVHKGAKNTINIGNDTFLSKSLILPTDDVEFGKIAEFLKKLSELIGCEKDKLKSIKNHKIGLMRELFPHGDIQKPRLRFSEFKTAPNWEYKKFNEVFNRIKRKNSENNQNVLTISAQEGLVSQLEYFNKSVSAKDVNGYYLLKKGDFAYNKSYSNGYPMGAIKPLKKYDKGVVSTLYICFKPKDKYVSAFLEQYFESGMLNSEIANIAQEGARNHGLLNVGINDFFNTRLIIPKDIKEQQKIASCLSAVDELIIAQGEKIEQLQQHKKGLIQGLFPKIES